MVIKGRKPVAIQTSDPDEETTLYYHCSCYKKMYPPNPDDEHWLSSEAVKRLKEAGEDLTCEMCGKPIS